MEYKQFLLQGKHLADQENAGSRLGAAWSRNRYQFFGGEIVKVVFLDIDGVLVTSRHFVQSKEYFGHEYDPVCTENLKQIVRETDAKTLVSSS